MVSGMGEIGALRVSEAMCHSDSLMRPRWLEMLHRNCWQSSPPAQNPRPASRFRLDKRDERCGPALHAAERGGSLQRLPAPKAAGEARHDLLLANPPQPRLDYLRQVGRPGFVTISGLLSGAMMVSSNRRADRRPSLRRLHYPAVAPAAPSCEPYHHAPCLFGHGWDYDGNDRVCSVSRSNAPHVRIDCSARFSLGSLTSSRKTIAQTFST